ncbi:unnamed protein product [Schistocephalus solidus]|uniref:Spt5-NGN domain-containing protein n=1 Tax=Schistocephalus solidus TaxID=70667 RepID=A0A183T2P1_SCHSO|nr:unnamed protein product [Schistocephalus solidus]
MPTFEKMPISSVDYADPRTLIMEHSREDETEEDGGQCAALLHSVGHCECFVYSPVFSDARHHPVVKVEYHVREPLRIAELRQYFPQSVVIHRVKGFHQMHEVRIEVGSHPLAFISYLAIGENLVGISATRSAYTGSCSIYRMQTICYYMPMKINGPSFIDAADW